MLLFLWLKLLYFLLASAGKGGIYTWRRDNDDTCRTFQVVLCYGISGVRASPGNRGWLTKTKSVSKPYAMDMLSPTPRLGIMPLSMLQAHVSGYLVFALLVCNIQ